MYKYAKFSLIRVLEKYDYCTENIHESLHLRQLLNDTIRYHYKVKIEFQQSVLVFVRP